MIDHTRRKFIRNASCAAVGSVTLSSTLFNLGALKAAAYDSMPNNPNDYRALVCLLLGGGNDAYNMLLPGDGIGTPGATTKYDVYKASRSNLALEDASILKSPTLSNKGNPLALHPSLSRAMATYNAGEMAFIANIGTLVEPVLNKTQIDNNLKKLPLGLYSHSDQSLHWQTGIPHDRVSVGWGGKIADLIKSCNSNQKIGLNLSLSGSNTFQAGNETVEYALDPKVGSVVLNNDGGTWLLPQIVKKSLDSLLYKPYGDAFQKTYVDVIRNSREGSAQFISALANRRTYTQAFPMTDLGDSLKLIADVVDKRMELGDMRRQIFFVEVGGWDHHDEVLIKQNDMLDEVDRSLHAFKLALKQIGMFNNVTTFTMSEFARTLTSNGNGTDHAWGSNVMVMGGDVDGGKVFGTYPDLNLKSSIDLGSGVLIPSTSTDEYFAELAMWFGVSPSNLALLYPNIPRFYNTASSINPIGFLKSRGMSC